MFLITICGHNTKAAMRVAAAMFLILFGCVRVSAHEGPPFPLVLDMPLAESKISIWADPDIGEAHFFIVIENAAGNMPEKIPDVSFWSEPVDGHLERETYPTVRSSLRNRLQFEAKPFFDQQDMWKIGVQIANPGSEPLEFATEVESTPPGLGPWDFAIYLFPFLLVGGMWVIAIVRHRRNAIRDHSRIEGTITNQIVTIADQAEAH